MALTPRTIELHVEALVLEGVAPSARQSVADALQVELARLFAGGSPALDAPASASRLDAPPMSVTMQATPQALGAAIATSVHAGFIS